MSHLGKPIHDHHNYILPSLGSRESNNEIHAHNIPWLHWYGQWGVQTLVELTLGFVANETSRNHLVNITAHPRLVEMLFQDINCFVEAKMPS